jgi:hypothetical protein
MDGSQPLSTSRSLALLGQLELQLALRQRLADAAQQELDDRLDLVLLQLVEDDHVVDPVEELRAGRPS